VDKIFDQVLKNVPPEFIPALLAICVAFFGVYYVKGLRNFTDAVADPAFLTLAVLVVAGFAIFYIQKPARIEGAQTDARPLLLIPRFEDDERRQYEFLFSKQLQAFVSGLNKQASIVSVDGYIRDRRTAQLMGKDYNAAAVLYEPRVIRVEEKKEPVLCFNLLILDPDRTVTYAAVKAVVERPTLESLSGTLLESLPEAAKSRDDPLLARIDALERKLNDLSTALHQTNALVQGGGRDVIYGIKRAVIIGINFGLEERIPRLRYADSDARRVAEVLQGLGFETTLLLNDHATHATVQDAVANAVQSSKEDDFLVVYYAGNSFRSTELSSEARQALVLNTFDLRLDQVSDNLTLEKIVEQLRSASNIYRLVIIDGCNGTYGLSERNIPSEHPLQVISGTQDTEYGVEEEQFGGGVFTHLFTKQLTKAVNQKRDISTSELMANILFEISRLNGITQRPKLVQLAGKEDLRFNTPDLQSPMERKRQ
jgi:hypothetical protein